MTLQEGYFFSF